MYLYSTTNNVLINFISDKDVQREGFQIQLVIEKLNDYQVKENLDYESVLNDLPQRRILPDHSGNSGNDSNNGEKVIPLAMAVMLRNC